MQVPSATSQASAASLPDEWVDRIFTVMENRYLAKWFDSFGGIPKARVKAQWAHELEGFVPQAIKRGLEAEKPNEGMLAPRNSWRDWVGLISAKPRVSAWQSHQAGRGDSWAGSFNHGFDS